MGKPQALAKLALMCLLCILIISGCRLRKGEDLSETNKIEVAVFKDSLTYTKDETTGLCYAILNNPTDGFRSTLTFTTVPCGKVGL